LVDEGERKSERVNESGFKMEKGKKGTRRKEKGTEEKKYRGSVVKRVKRKKKFFSRNET
jgi:hypothetical protein